VVLIVPDKKEKKESKRKKWGEKYSSALVFHA
jgi:hypothetical protein